MSSIYIHIPFCHHKCIYCDFYSIAKHSPEKMLDSYVDCLIKEIKQRKDFIDSSLTTIYIGGGTPSLLSINQLKRLFKEIHHNFDTKDVSEITMETNPEDLNEDYLKAIRDLGINRLSIGVQSFNDNDLKMLNRCHSSRQSKQAITNALNVGINNISIDLMYNLPMMNSDSWKNNLDVFLTFSLPHISCYSLTVEQNTMIYKLIEQNKMTIPEEKEMLDEFDLTMEVLKDNNYIHYETSSYCKKGFQSKHNYNYWTFGKYLGLGAAAHSYDGQQRCWNENDIDKYINNINNNYLNNSNKELLTNQEKYEEYVMLSSRLMRGLNEEAVKIKFPEYFNHFKKNMLSLKEEGYFDENYCLTTKGWHLQNEIALNLML